MMGLILTHPCQQTPSAGKWLTARTPWLHWINPKMNPRMIVLWSNPPIPDLAQVKFVSLVMRRTTMATWVIQILIKGTKDWFENIIKNRFPLALPNQEQTHSIKEQSSTYIMARRHENEKLPVNRLVKMSTNDLLNSKNELYCMIYTLFCPKTSQK